MNSSITLSSAVEISINERKATYEAAHTAFKRHEAWGWHLVKDFMIGLTASDPMQAQEKATIQEGVDTYHKLHAELKRAKKAYKKAKAKAKAKENCNSTTTSEPSESYSPSEPIPTEVIGEVEKVEESYYELYTEIWFGPNATYESAVHETRRLNEAMGWATPQPQPEPKSYHDMVKDKWQAENSNFYTALRKFRRFKAVGGLATFVVLKDGANYEGMSLKMEELTVAGLRLWASILQAPYASKLRRAELEDLLRPVLMALTTGPTPNRWAYL